MTTNHCEAVNADTVVVASNVAEAAAAAAQAPAASPYLRRQTNNV